MSSPDLPYRSATDLCAAIRHREISSLELLDCYLERVDRLNPRINAVVAQDREGARARAREADEALARGQSVGALHGLPMTIKDSFEVVGMPTTSGAPELKDHLPAENATSAQRLLDAGAVIFGKTNLPLYAGDCQSYNEVYGTTNNPWDPTRGPGGSSGVPRQRSPLDSRPSSSGATSLARSGAPPTSAVSTATSRATA